MIPREACMTRNREGDVSMKLIFAGTGDALGIPAIGCGCKICTMAREKEGKNRRRRSSVILSNNSDTLLYDTPPTIGDVLNQNRIFHISAIFLSHKHYDHIGGITEFEYWPEKIPVYGNMSALGNFEITGNLYENCEFHVLHDRKTVKVNSIEVTPFPILHSVPTYGMVFSASNKRIVHFNDKQYLQLNDYQKAMMEKANVAVFHTPGYSGKTGHTTVSGVMMLAKKYPDTRIVISHIGHNNLSHEEIEENVSTYENIIVAYDNMEIEV